MEERAEGAGRRPGVKPRELTSKASMLSVRPGPPAAPLSRCFGSEGVKCGRAVLGAGFSSDTSWTIVLYGAGALRHCRAAARHTQHL